MRQTSLPNWHLRLVCAHSCTSVAALLLPACLLVICWRHTHAVGCFHRCCLMFAVTAPTRLHAPTLLFLCDGCPTALQEVRSCTPCSVGEQVRQRLWQQSRQLQGCSSGKPHNSCPAVCGRVYVWSGTAPQARHRRHSTACGTAPQAQQTPLLVVAVWQQLRRTSGLRSVLAYLYQ